MAIKDKTRVDDFYSRKAREEGYPARSVYKLAEIDEKYSIFKNANKVLDLGCSPGSWTLYAAEKIGAKGEVIALDLNMPSTVFPENVTFLQADLLKDEPQLIHEKFPFDIILSDMAPKTMGRREVDQARSLDLCQMAWSWAERFLKKDGIFMFKIFQSQDADDFIKTLKTSFKNYYRIKPKATRSQSLEVFVLYKYYKKNV